MSFHMLGVMPELVASVARLGWAQPTPVQAEVIPALLAGEDLLVSAQTGTGKSGSFLLPLLQRLSSVRGEPH
ncbi:MAG: DEAD/DEAH box helicase, partial [Aeromonadaceae bacterium]